MARIELAPEVFDDFERILDHLRSHAVAEAPARIAGIVEAIQVLARNPLIGRPARGGARELVIGRGAQGYVALYRFIAGIDTVFILAIRAQREAGYRRGA
jgi:plasmid stabilization system protein ParE